MGLWKAGAGVLVGSALVVGVVACSAQEGAGRAADSSVTIGVSYEPESLSPLLGYGKDGNSKIFDGLLQRDQGLELEPALATALPEVSEDGLTYTFQLREGVRFSDGTPFTAADVVFTYTTILDAKTNNGYASELDAIAKVEADGEHKVVFTLKYPYAPFIERTVLPIASAKAAGGQDPNTGEYNTKPVGTGPYVVSSWRKGEKLTLKANPDYWGGAPEITDFTVAFIPDDDVRATRLRAGELDGAALPPSVAEPFRKLDGMTVLNAKSVDYRTVTLPTANPVTGDKAVRRALNLAVDRDLMVESILKGSGRPAYSPLPDDNPWFLKSTKITRNEAEAARILDDAGWKPGDDGVRVKDGKRASFTLWYFSGDKLRQDHALAFASDAKKVGVEVKVQAGTREVVQPLLGKDPMLAGGGAGFDPDFDLYPSLYSKLGGDGWNNMPHYANGAVDRALEIGRESGDETERKLAYETVQDEFAKDPGYAFLTFIDHVYVMADGYADLTTQVEPHDHGLAGGPWWNLEDWRLPK
ncbi:ABC transporter substrate-binding protein [Actinocorallia sp. A-T 12471]|uniref:ABC transporter substrate-binding protein n=1 Tax=Actinocorallia sp. A-T 12471 TaxID=3089813 RepID=UPI0029CDE490|nr:ABC transporter substrate-binding protein [Actinocorallia sp. A-T 12471]MDX6742681.1 ABC transporter substrate-binding protein [Actinocorallia sp. A-T 12471]